MYRRLTNSAILAVVSPCAGGADGELPHEVFFEACRRACQYLDFPCSLPKESGLYQEAGYGFRRLFSFTLIY